MNKLELIELVKSAKFAQTTLIISTILPCILYPITTLSIFALQKQIGFAKLGVMYEPTMTEYTLSVFGLFYLPYGYILSFSIALFCIGVWRIYVLSKITSGEMNSD